MQHTKNKRYFITATDTDAGKTTVTKLLMQQIIDAGLTAIACKPIACGVNAQGLNEDAEAYHQLNSLPLTEREINPLCFDLPASPNIAASKSNQRINVGQLAATLTQLFSYSADYLFFEGIGGWEVPLNDQENLPSLIAQLGVPIIVVVGIRVGCLNHAILTNQAIRQANIPIAGWIANVVDKNTPEIDCHITTLSQKISAPYLGLIPYQAHDNFKNTTLNFNLLL